jgi:hypothetical protein
MTFGKSASRLALVWWDGLGPQSDIAKELVDARDKVWMSGVKGSNYNAENPARAKLDRQIRDLDENLAQQRAQAKPYPYRFEIRKIAP